MNYRVEIFKKYHNGDKVSATLTIDTIGYKYVTCTSTYDKIHTVKYTLQEFYQNFI